MLNLWKIVFTVFAMSVVAFLVWYEAICLAENKKPTFKAVPILSLNGKNHDTTYLYAEYSDPGAYYLERDEMAPSCSDTKLVTDVRGHVNTHVLGSYCLSYHAYDNSGKELAPATRTVVVVENKLAYLNGNYQVVYTGTVTSLTTRSSSTTTGSFTTQVKTASRGNCFNVMSLFTGTEHLNVDACVLRDSVELGFWSPDYARIETRGKLSPSRTSFTIETVVYPYAVNAVYRFRNTYTKQLIISEAEPEKFSRRVNYRRPA